MTLDNLEELLIDTDNFVSSFELQSPLPPSLWSQSSSSSLSAFSTSSPSFSTSARSPTNFRQSRRPSKQQERLSCPPVFVRPIASKSSVICVRSSSCPANLGRSPKLHTKLQRHTYSFHRKQDVLGMYDSFRSLSKTSAATGIHPRVIQRWIQQRCEIMSPSIELSRSRKKGGGRKPLSVALDAQLAGTKIFTINKK